MAKKLKIQIRDLYKSFGKNHVLQGVNLDIHEGESVVVIGGSGTGKSVLLKCILGLVTPDKGSIKVDGQEIINMRPSEKDKVIEKFGMLFQGGALFDSLPVWKNVSFDLIYNKGAKVSKAREIATKKLKEVGLSEKILDLSPAELSGGMQKRVGLARAIASNPEILFFDEPTTGLDPIMCGTIDNLIKSSVKHLGATAISITHDMTSAKFIADRLAMICEGKIIWEGTVKELDTCKNDTVQHFINGHKHYQTAKKQD